MDLLQLHYFRVTARTENVTRAAKELGVSQPTVSKAVALVEETLGVPLFERHGKKLRLNACGEAYLRRVERCFLELRDGQRELDALAGTERRSVTVGAACSLHLPALLSGFLQGSPEAEFKIRHIPARRDMEQKLLSGEIDFAVLPGPADSGELQSQPLLTEEIFLAVPPGHALEGRQCAPLRELFGEPFVGAVRGSGFWELTEGFFREAGFSPAAAFEIESFEAMADLVCRGFGFALLPALPPGEARPTLLRAEDPACRRTLFLAWARGRFFSETAAGFKSFAAGFFSGWADI